MDENLPEPKRIKTEAGTTVNIDTQMRSEPLDADAESNSYTVEDLEKFQTLKKLLHPKKLDPDTDFLIYVMKTKTQVAAVVQTVRQNLKYADYFAVLERTRHISTYKNIKKHQALEIDISCLFIEDVKLDKISKSLDLLTNGCLVDETQCGTLV